MATLQIRAACDAVVTSQPFTTAARIDIPETVSCDALAYKPLSARDAEPFLKGLLTTDLNRQIALLYRIAPALLPMRRTMPKPLGHCLK